jgi:exocyst complex component 8
MMKARQPLLVDNFLSPGDCRQDIAFNNLRSAPPRQRSHTNAHETVDHRRESRSPLHTTNLDTSLPDTATTRKYSMDSKGISLRKKRTVKTSKISAPQQISGPLPAGFKSPGESAAASTGRDIRPKADGTPRTRQPGPRERPQQADKTADLVKRRYSTRYTQLPQDFNAGAPPLPNVPTIPSQFQNTPPRPTTREGRRGVGGDGQRIKLDQKALQDPNLKPEQYVASLLADATEEDIANYQQELRKAKNRTSQDLQLNVYQNRTQFIKISKEAEKLKTEMRTLRSLLSDLTGTLGQTTPGNTPGFGSDTLTARKQANRSSVANLEALWNSHLQTLWKRVEGSQKYLPAIPGRHIVYESGRWVELNAATWRARRRVHLILLNDHLLVAAEKKRADAPTQNSKDARQKQGRENVPLVAQRCWPLQDVQLADLSTRSVSGNRETGESRPGAKNAINIRVGNDSFTFATGNADAPEKATLLSTYRKAKEDLRKTIEAETEERGKVQDSVNYFATRDLSILKKPDLLGSLSDHRSSITIDVDGKQQSIRWLESQLDDLDIDIALQRFEQAVARVEKLKRTCKGIKGNSVAQELLTFKISERAAKLAAVLTKQLVETHSWATATKNHVSWLMRLGFEDRAREAYLEARSQVIKRRTR